MRKSRKKQITISIDSKLYEELNAIVHKSGISLSKIIEVKLKGFEIKDGVERNSARREYSPRDPQSKQVLDDPDRLTADFIETVINKERKYCMEQGCKNPVSMKGLCQTHFYKNRGMLCNAIGCNRPVVSGGIGLCQLHASQERYAGKGNKVRLCSVEGCGRIHTAKGLCRQHYYAARGRIRPLAVPNESRGRAKHDD